MQVKNNIALVLPYYGSLPCWVTSFLRSCAYNAGIDWLIITDLSLPDLPPNVRKISLQIDELSQLIEKQTGISHSLNYPHKLCDFKPLYGHIFEEQLHPYAYWGHCDLDVIWGNLEQQLEAIRYKEYDVISSRPRSVSGHMTLYRNSNQLNRMYRQVPNYQNAFKGQRYQGFDEGYFSYFLFKEVNNSSLKAFWPKHQCIDRGQLRRRPNGWFWENGKVQNTNGKNGWYIHFMDWKRTMELEVLPESNKAAFQVTRYGIWKLGYKVPFMIRIKLWVTTGIFYQLSQLILRYILFLTKPIRRKKNHNGPFVPGGYERLEV